MLFKAYWLVLLIMCSFKGHNGTVYSHAKNKTEDPIITRLREYLRIKSVHPNPDYEGCISWLKKQAKEIGLKFNVARFEPPNLFAVYLTWQGSNPELKSIMINSHMDVVPADLSKWLHPPFEAYKDENGNIFARGASDMKSATVATLEAIRRLKKSSFKPKRTVVVSIVPDEEIGGMHGMEAFVKSPQFASLNTGLVWGEGDPGGSIVYGEKSTWRFNFTSKGKSSHSSSMPVETAVGKLRIVIDKLLDFRTKQLNLLKDPSVSFSDITSLNLVRLGGGIADNTIPDEAWASFDMRIRLKPNWTFADVERMLNDTAREAGNGVSYKYILKSTETGVTPIDDSNIWWTTVQKSCRELNATCNPVILSPQTDARYARHEGIPAFGMNPLLYEYTKNSGPHVDNENINEKDVLNGVDRYALHIANFASVS